MAKDTMIVISRGYKIKKSDKKYEDAVLKQLSEAGGVRILIIPHIYYLKKNQNIYCKILDFKGTVVVCSWLFDRASRWVMEKELCFPEKTVFKYFSFKKYKKPSELVSLLRKISGMGKNVKEMPEDESKTSVAERWYPVIDYSKCKNCRKCLEFCVFGVYTLGKKKKVKVENPEKCKPGCPACSRVCPKGAIMFPHYFDDEKICGME